MRRITCKVTINHVNLRTPLIVLTTTIDVPHDVAIVPGLRIDDMRIEGLRYYSSTNSYTAYQTISCYEPEDLAKKYLADGWKQEAPKEPQKPKGKKR